MLLLCSSYQNWCERLYTARISLRIPMQTASHSPFLYPFWFPNFCQDWFGERCKKSAIRMLSSKYLMGRQESAVDHIAKINQFSHLPVYFTSRPKSNLTAQRDMTNRWSKHRYTQLLLIFASRHGLFFHIWLHTSKTSKGIKGRHQLTVCCQGSRVSAQWRGTNIQAVSRSNATFEQLSH